MPVAPDCAPVDPALTGWLAGLDPDPRPTIDFLVTLNSAAHQAVVLHGADGNRRTNPGPDPHHRCRLVPRLGLVAGRCSAALRAGGPFRVRLPGPARRGASARVTQERGSPTCTPGRRRTCRARAGSGWIRPRPCSPPRDTSRSPRRPARCRRRRSRVRPDRQGRTSISQRRAPLRRRAASHQPYSDAQREAQHRLGTEVDQRLTAAGLELTMGGEPTFVSRDSPTAPEWTVAADGGRKRSLAVNWPPTRRRLRLGWADPAQPGPVVSRRTHPRWQVGLVWRRDGQPLWRNPSLLADPFDEVADDAGRRPPTPYASAVADPWSPARAAASVLRTREKEPAAGRCR